jgi:hypothetical protein
MLGASAAVVATAALGTQVAFAQNPSDVSAACAKLATLFNFPVVPTQITVAKFSACGSTSQTAWRCPIIAKCRESSTSVWAETRYGGAAGGKLADASNCACVAPK